MSTVTAAPDGAKDAGTRLWKAILGRYELEEHEIALLTQAVRVADLCADLQSYIDLNGPMLSGRLQGRMRPAVAELRQQRIAFARLMAAMRVPIGDQEEDPARTSNTPRLQRRGGVRGVYAINGGRKVS